MRAVVVVLGLAAAACSTTRTRLPVPLSPPADVPLRVVDVAPLRPSRPPATDCSIAPASGPSPWWADSVGYEVFVRSFRDSDGDGVGDLAGLSEKLDYLNDGDPATDTDLGIGLLWLMPVTRSPSIHGYDVTDYRDVEPDYGTLEALAMLTAEAKKRGIAIVADLVINHTSRLHPWFQASKRSPSDPKRGWYRWLEHPPSGWGQPWSTGTPVWHPAKDGVYYGVFSPDMPDLDFTNAEVRAEIADIARFWLERGLAGFRLDAARYLVETGPGAAQADTPETHATWRELGAAMRTTRADALLLGEVWTATTTVATYVSDGAELSAAFDFDRAEALRTGLRTGALSAWLAAICRATALVPTPGRLFTFATNHDLERLPTALGASTSPALLRLAAVLALTSPGTPMLYYGEELGLPNGPRAGDLGARLPMPWDTSPTRGFSTGAAPWSGADTLAPAELSVGAQWAEPTSLLSLHRRLIRLRRAHPALMAGGFRRLDAGAQGLVAYVRPHGTRPVVVVANPTRTSIQDVRVDLAPILNSALASTVHALEVSAPDAPRLEGALLVLGHLPPATYSVVELSLAP